MKKSLKYVLLSVGLLFNFSIKIQCENQLPIIYHPGYDISFLGLEKLHPFDTHKYSRVFKSLEKYFYPSLVQKNIFKKTKTPQWFYQPTQEVSEQDLLKVHSPEYLDSLNSSSTVARIAELPLLAILPNWLQKKWLLNPMKLATQGTILATELAFEKGWAINLSGGYHHAKKEGGEGFCFYADMPLAIKKLREKIGKKLRVLYIDLDAHQGNGVEDILLNDEDTVIFDIYNYNVYPRDLTAAQRINYHVPLNKIDSTIPQTSLLGLSLRTSDDEYLDLLKTNLSAIFEDDKFDLIVYNAGTDIYEKDPLGGLNISAEAIIKRDQLVWDKATETNTPIVMTLSGGYTSESADIISKSIKSVLIDRIN